MPAYTTSDLVRGATGMTDETLITDAYVDLKIAGATGLINGKIGDAYVLPLATVPDLIEWLALEITVCLLFMDQFGEETGDSDKGWDKRLKVLMLMLEDIRTLKTKLYDDSTGVELPHNSLLSPAFYPNAASDDPSYPNTTKSKITMNRRY